MKILSVDWDYFFPNPAFYDWGHVEAPLMIDYIWQLRVGSVNVVNGKSAVEEMLPDENLLKGFWSRVLSANPEKLVIADSHLHMYFLLQSVKSEYGGGVDVVNFDQHHDIYYPGQNPVDTNNVDCSNWAGAALEMYLMNEYTLVYPPWRTKKSEQQEEQSRPTEYDEQVTVQYSEPVPDSYDIVFICRSGAWTPSWADHRWLDFIGVWRERSPQLWKDRKSTGDIESERHPSLNEAREERKNILEEMQKLRQNRGVDKDAQI